MTITLVFQHEDGQECVECSRVLMRAGDVREDDYFLCPVEGYVHVHAVSVEDGRALLSDCDEHEHVYSVNTILEVARPVEISHA